MNEEIKDYFKEIRKCDACKEEMRIRHPQVGILNKNSKYLFIFQNPAQPNIEKSQEDKILMDKNITDDEFDRVYREGYLKWNPYNKFIKLIINEGETFSILNICRCPTKNNQTPTCEMIEMCCDKYLLKAIEYINPKIIICQGNVAKVEIIARGIDKKYKTLFYPHYSYLFRQGTFSYLNIIREIREKIEEIEKNEIL